MPGGWRLWYKDEADGSTTWAADSPDLYRWDVVGRVIGGRPHEGPNVFRLGGHGWMIVDEWRGQMVYRSDDLSTWEQQGLLLDGSGSRPDDTGPGLHADVVPVSDDEAWIVYFTHPGPESGAPGAPVVDEGRGLDDGPGGVAADRRSSVQAAVLRVVDGVLVCDRDAPVETLLPG
ncbi:hypothetical protein GCM10025865_06720 [Paraoerskovia sediminicola]|uniref:Glycosyl hydrolases family 43 n=1 Tax=Paraoerskovia sediminicola TaxID=1138587 RepID=A0ABN6XAY2_9CELL|nr:hypothetical protein [Paraoerskovia sediminicola]BDZ41373.1 hypothetical protein GCM10025865_06720 [Paraoerskovia sediminicola]